MDMDIVTDIVETHTFDYHLYVDTLSQVEHGEFDDWSAELVLLCQDFVRGVHEYCCNITFFDEEDRQRIKAFVEEHNLIHYIVKNCRAMDD